MTKVAIVTGLPSSHSNSKRHLKKLKEFVVSRGYEVVDTIQLAVSGAKGVSETEARRRLLDMAISKKIDKVLADHISTKNHAPDRIINTIELIHKCNVSIIPVDFIRVARKLAQANQENKRWILQHPDLETLDQDGKITESGKAISMMLDITHQFSLRQGESTKAGMKRASLNGKHIGRPKGTTMDDAAFLKKHEKVSKMLEINLTIQDIASLCGVSKSTVHKVKKILANKK